MRYRIQRVLWLLVRTGTQLSTSKQPATFRRATSLNKSPVEALDVTSHFIIILLEICDIISQKICTNTSFFLLKMATLTMTTPAQSDKMSDKGRTMIRTNQERVYRIARSVLTKSASVPNAVYRITHVGRERRRG